MTTENLIQQVVERDRQLEKQAEGATLALMEHRWHWTLDESNPERVGIREYARALNRDEATIRTYANGYTIYTAAGSGPRTPTESLERGKVSAEQEVAIEAVAEAHGTSFGYTRKTMGDEVQRVREYGRTQVETGKAASVADPEPGPDMPTYQDATRHYANWLRDTERAEQRTREERRQRIGPRYAELDGRLLAARRDLRDALRVAAEVDWGDEERELLLATIRQVEQMLALIDKAVTKAGTQDVDWEAEINSIFSGGAKA